MCDLENMTRRSSEQYWQNIPASPSGTPTRTSRAQTAWLRKWWTESAACSAPHCCRVHPDLSFFSPFGCSMVVHRGKDLVEHHKLAPRGEKYVYLGCGNAYGRRAYIAYSPRLHRVFSTIHAEFDESFFPFRKVDQRARGRNDNTT